MNAIADQIEANRAAKHSGQAQLPPNAKSRAAGSGSMGSGPTATEGAMSRTGLKKAPW